MERVLVEVRVYGRADRSQAEHNDSIATSTVILPHCLGVVDAAVEVRKVVLSYTDDSLDDKYDIRNQAKFSVDRNKVRRCFVGDFVIFDNDKPADQGENAGPIQDSVYVCTRLFLFGSVGRLQNEYALGYEKYAGGIQELNNCELYSGM